MWADIPKSRDRGRTPIVPDPAEIQQQIEQTRAELASTVDAIADRVSPKRVAARTKVTIKEKVDDLRSRGTVPALEGGASAGQDALPARVASQLREAKRTGGRSVRWDRVAMVGGGIALIVVFLRRRGR
jgi:hypothetical protein